MYRDNYSSGFETVTGIRPIIIITFRTTSAMVDNGITFGAHIGFSSRYCNIIVVVPSKDIVTLNTVHKRPQCYCSCAKPKYCYIYYSPQTIALHAS